MIRGLSGALAIIIYLAVIFAIGLFIYWAANKIGEIRARRNARIYAEANARALRDLEAKSREGTR